MSLYILTSGLRYERPSDPEAWPEPASWSTLTPGPVDGEYLLRELGAEHFDLAVSLGVLVAIP